MRTADEPLLAAYLWQDHLANVRGWSSAQAHANERRRAAMTDVADLINLARYPITEPRIDGARNTGRSAARVVAEDRRR